MTEPLGISAYYTVRHYWIAYQQQLQFLNEQADSLLDALDDTLLQQIQTLTYVSNPSASSTLPAAEQLRFLDGRIKHLLQQHHGNRRLIRDHLQAEQTALYESLKQVCEQPLQRIVGTLFFQPRFILPDRGRL